MMLIKHITWLALLMLLSGCQYVQVQSSQLSGLVAQFSTPELDLTDNSWSVRYGDYQSVVYTVTLPEGTLFSNSAGDEIFFDGWSIRKFKLMGSRRAEYVISDTATERTFLQGKRTLAVHSCLAWMRQQQAGKTQFSQPCEASIAYSNSILVAEDGSISIIRQVVDNAYNAMTLTKLN